MKKIMIHYMPKIGGIIIVLNIRFMNGIFYLEDYTIHHTSIHPVKYIHPPVYIYRAVPITKGLKFRIEIENIIIDGFIRQRILGIRAFKEIHLALHTD